MVKQSAVCLALLVVTGLPIRAQSPPTSQPLTTYLQRSFAAVSKNLAAAAELMPAENFGFKPAGAAKEVRTFAQLIEHIVVVNSYTCGFIKPAPAPKVARAADEPVKPALIKAIAESTAFCTDYLATLTDAALLETVTGKAGDREVKTVKANAIIFAIAHSNEHYGNIVTYLRANGLVPPSTAAQAGWLSPVTR